MLPNLHAIVLDQTPERTDALAEHLEAIGMDWVPFRDIHAESWGLTTTIPYEHNGQSVIMPQKHVGLHLSHYMLWRVFENSYDYDHYGPDSQFTVIEDDCRFKEDFQESLELAKPFVPPDWDMLMLGSCCTEGRKQLHRGGNVYEVEYPLCTHAYMVRGKALEVLIPTQEKSWANIDLSLYFNSYPLLKVYTLLPRIADQANMELPV